MSVPASHIQDARKQFIRETIADLQELEQEFNDLRTATIPSKDKHQRLHALKGRIELIEISINDLDKPELRLKVQNIKQKLADFKRELIINSNPTISSSAEPQVQEKINLRRLEEAQQQLLAAEEAGAETLNHLKTQREIMKGIKSKLKEVHDELGGSAKLVSAMQRWWRG